MVADRKTVIRGGYDIFFSNAFATINSPGQASANAPGWNQEYDWDGTFYPNQCSAFSGQCVAFPLSDTTTPKGDLTTPSLPSTFPAAQRASLLGTGLVQFFTPPDHDPMVETWSLEVERQLPGNMMISVGYVGNHGTHLVGETFRQFNYVHTADLIKYKTGINANVPITQVYSGQTANELQQVYGTSTLPLNVLLKQYPFYGATGQLQNNTAFDGTSIYHGVNVKFQKQYSHGLNFLVAYTVSKDITNAAIAEPASELVNPVSWGRAGGVGGRAGTVSGLIFGGTFQNPDNRKADRTIAAGDIPQILNIAGTYELPFGTGRLWLQQGGLLNLLVGGWKLTPNFNAESGLPLAISCPGDQLTSRCNQIGNPGFSGNRTKAQRIADWINPAAFEPAFGSDQSFWANYDPNDPRAYQFGTMGPRLANFRGPGFWNLDASLDKEFHLTEAKYFEFRWDVFNALNHQNPGSPNTGFCLPLLPGGSPDKVHQAGCQFGRITNIQTDPRSMEFALKFYW